MLIINPFSATDDITRYETPSLLLYVTPKFGYINYMNSPATYLILYAKFVDF
jgi:hypothetical protein